VLEPGDLVIEDMEKEDIDAVVSLERLIFPTPWSKDIFLHELMSRPKAVLLVARTGGRLCGYLVARVFIDTVHITNIAVEPQMRRRGVGTALMRECIFRCLSRGIRFLRLEVRENNFPARRFYEKLGFRELGLKLGYYSDTGEHAVIMASEISPPDDLHDSS